ncbi:MAG: spore maturation protein [Clostridia bacterium]|nr:spore maturation protein [Clostridia bacterium]
MRFIEYFSKTAIIFFILIIVLYGMKEKKNVFSLFLQGVIEGEKIVIELFPTLLALIVSVGMLNASGVIDVISKWIAPILNIFNINNKLAPLILLRPISGSTTTAIATNLMKQYGVDSSIGLISSCIMGATETTIYVVSIYSSKVNIKNVKEVIIIGLIADFIGILASCMAYRLQLI